MGDHPDHPSSRNFLTVHGMRDEYGIPISTQRLWRKEGRFVPWYRAGGNRIAYRRVLVEKWIEEQEREHPARPPTEGPCPES